MPPVGESSTRIQSVREFYDTLAQQYDAMTSFEKRFEKERPAFRTLIERYGIKRALDAGSGSGFHSILLAQLGVDVTALDLSSEMVRLTEENARRYTVAIKVFGGAFRDIPLDWSGSCDAVFVMGNSLPHLLSQKELTDALSHLLDVLRPHGVLIVQCLNYEKILDRKDHVLNTREVDGMVITREYDYDSDGIRFSVVTRNVGRGKDMEKRETVRLRPILRSELVELLDGLDASTESFGNIMLEPYQSATSTDLVVVATKRWDQSPPSQHLGSFKS
jgi:glycine/sarcosine N-methyltransferase